MGSVVRLLLVLVAAAGFAGAARAAPGLLVTASELAPLVEAGAIVVLDIRSAAPGTEVSPYEAGHIPDAVPAPYPLWRGPAEYPGKLPDLPVLEELVRQAGIDGSKPVAIVHAGTDAADFGAAARVYWTLKMMDLPQLAVLNGGMQAWRDAGLPVSTETPVVVPSAFTADGDESIWATRAEVEQEIATGGSTRLLDARPPEFFWGKLWHDAARKPGTIAGAESFPYARWFIDGGPLIVGPEAARRIALEAGLDQAPITVSFCNTGHWAAINWFALSELAGVPGVKLYPEFVVDWSQAELPMDHVPGRIEWLWLSTKKWFGQTFG